MRRVLFHLPFGDPGPPIFAYGFMLMLGFLAGIALAVWRARREGIPESAIYDIAICAIVSGIVGARVMWVWRFAEPWQLQGPIDYIAVWNGGLVYYGGLLLALATCTAYVLYKRLPLGRTADCFAPGLGVGLGFGRIGCFLNGCCFGAPCPVDAWYAVRFPADAPAALQHAELGLTQGGASLPVYPTQLFASAAGFLIGGLILLLFRYRRFPGQMILAFVLLYSAARFLIEFFRADTLPRLWDLKEGQLVAAPVFVAAAALTAILWIRAARRRKGSGPEEADRGA